MLEDKFVSVIVTQYREQETKTLVLVVATEVAAPMSVFAPMQSHFG